MSQVCCWHARDRGRRKWPYFFFQAEDGIRCADVTGVQTCALPIYDYFYSFFADAEKHKHYGFALPIILIDNGLKVFMSSEDFVYNGKVVEKDGQHYKFYHGKIYKTDAEGTINYDEKHHPTNEKPLDFSI